jgi:hypothetical protein
MFPMTAHPRRLSLIAITMLIAALPAAQAQAPAGAKRPAAVPANYIITPFGYFHPSCVVRLAEGDEVRQDLKVIQHANGTSEATQACAFPHFTADGIAVVGDQKAPSEPSSQPVISHAWVEYAGTTSTSSYAYLYAHWNVPPAPSTNHGQTVYLFPGMQDYKDVVTIIQPVLGWNADYASAWGIASWNCCVSGTTYEAAPAPAKAGDVIYGYMSYTCPSGTLSCPSWNIVTQDLTSGKTSKLLSTSSFGQTFNWAFAGALEVYNISACTDYPTNGAISFYDIGLYNYEYTKIATPAWTVTNSSSGLTPQCSYGGSLPKEVTLTY